VTEWWDVVPFKDLIQEAQKLIGVYFFRVKGIPRKIKVTVKEYSTGDYLGTTDCQIQNPSQASPYRHSSPSPTAEDAVQKALTGIIWYLPKDLEELEKTLVVFDDGEKCFCQVED
jgi:hypothetical protein